MIFFVAGLLIGGPTMSVLAVAISDRSHIPVGWVMACMLVAGMVVLGCGMWLL